MSNADFLVECVTENSAIKKTVYHRLGELCPAKTIFASNTSFLNIFQLVPADRLPNTVIAHWFAPPFVCYG